MKEQVAQFLSLLQRRPLDQPDASAVRESGIDVAAWDRDFGQGLLNPDPLISRLGLRKIDEMRDDDALGAYMDMKKSARLCTNGSFKPASEEPDHIMHADYMRDMTQRWPGSIKDKLRSIMTAMEYGYSVTNKPLYEIPDGPFAGMIGIQDLKTKEPHRFRFRVDEFRNIIGLLHENPATLQWDELDAAEFIIYTYRGEFSNPYGRSDFRRAFRAWNSKKHTWKMWDMYLERFAGGFLDVTYAQNKQDKQEHDVIKTFVTDASSPRTGILHSDVYDIKISEPTGRGHATFDEAIKSRNIFMARAVLLPDLLGFSQNPGGAYALGKKHFDVFLWVLEDLGRDIEETIWAEQIIKEQIDMNFGVQEMYPAFKFDPMTDEQKIFILEQLYAAVKTGVITKDPEIENEVRKILNLPERDPEEIEKEKEEKERAQQFPPTDDNDKEDDDEGGRPFTGAAHIPIESKRVRKKTELEDKVDLQTMTDAIDTSTPLFVEAWSELLMLNQDALIKTVRETDIIVSGDTQALAQLSFKRKADMRKVLHRFMLNAYLTGALGGQREVEKAKLSSDDYASFQIDPNLKINDMYDFFSKLGLDISPTIKNGATTQIGPAAFRITGIQSEEILSAAKQVILNGMKRNNIEWTVRNLKKLFDGFVESGQLSASVAQRWRVQSIARTNFTAALNEGRRVRFNDPDVRDFIVAYQYSAILDDATTDYCAAMDKRVFTKEEMELEGFPPAHHQCRSIVVPVTEGEQFKLQKIPGGVLRAPGF